MHAASLDDLLSQIWRRKVPFIVVFFLVFSATYALLAVLDWLPEPIEVEESADDTTPREILPDTVAQVGSETGANNSLADSQVAEVNLAASGVAQSAVTQPVTEAGQSTVLTEVLPVEMTFTTLNRTVTVLNPTSRAIPDLDAALLDGVVRHPDSAHLGQTGTVFLLGHSSYLPTVQNRNFQAFNGIQNLNWGDTIVLRTSEQTFTYRVDRVYRARASELVVPIAGDEYRLTLATCNSFGSIDDRFIVEAIRVAVEDRTQAS